MKLHFISRLQLAFCIVFAVLAVLCYIAAFYNSFHVVSGCMSSGMAIASYKEKNW